MDRQTLYIALFATAMVAGCNRSKSPPPTAAPAIHKQESASRATTIHEMQPSGGGQVSEKEPSLAAAEAARIAALEAARAAAEREKALAEQQRASAQMYQRKTVIDFGEDTVTGALERPPADFGQPPAASWPGDANPLRGSASMAAPAADAYAPLPPSYSPPPSPATTSPPAGISTFGPSFLPEAVGSAAPSPEFDASPLPPPPAPAPVAPAEPPSDSQPYAVVQVFYGTDRQADQSPAGDWHAALSHFLPAGCTLLLSLCVAALAWSRPAISTWLTAVAGLAVSVGLGFQAASSALEIIRQSGKEGPRYTVERSPGGHVDRGVCDVTIPRSHISGELEAPDITHLEINESAARHVVLQTTTRMADARFYELLRERVQQSARRELFVFVHGFNVSFEDAARRTAQIHYDLQFDGAPIFFSWPAHDKFIFTYPADETNVAWSVPHLKQFLLEIVKESQAQSINLIAHSMGNRALAAALREIDLEMHDQARLFNQVILAAPDIDADEFRTNIAPAMQRTAQRLTLYASARDDALLVSRYLHRGPRAGDAGDGLVVVNGVDTIDVTPIDTSPWGHSYYGSSDPVLHDLRELLSRAIPPRDRVWLSPAERDGLTYWIFQPTRTAGAAETPLK